jgi:hypothetical protein
MMGPGHRKYKTPVSGAGVLSVLLHGRATGGGSARLYFILAAESFTGAWRHFHSPVGAGSCALPAIAAPGVWGIGGSIPPAGTV